MLKCKLQLRNSILGRGLFPVDGECKSILDKHGDRNWSVGCKLHPARHLRSVM